MQQLRILLVSRSRPSRTWKLADRLRREVPGAAIYGIVQQPMAQLPRVQQLIARGNTSDLGFPHGMWSETRALVRLGLEKLTHGALWLIHGCPLGFNAKEISTIADLSRACRENGCRFLVADGITDLRVTDFARQADLVIALDQISLRAETGAEAWAVPEGMPPVLHAVASRLAGEEDVQLKVEHYGRHSRVPFTIASFVLPGQPFDGVLGVTLKTDLLLNDLLLEASRSLVDGSPGQAAKDAEQWIRETLSPYLEQLQASRQSMPGTFPPKRCRKAWKLFLDTMLVCSPLFVVRNWSNRWRKRYRVQILTHHLVADRPHRMAISTEAFWRQIKFLQKHYQIVSLADAVACLSSESVSAPTVALTFDDGYCDNFVSLRSVAEETGIPVALFLSVQPIATRKEFQHDLDRGITGFLPLNWTQVQYWRERGAELGSHTMTHADCGAADQTTLEEEITGSKRALEERLKASVRFFAFPFGLLQNMSLPAVRMAESCYSHFLSGFGGENVPKKGAGSQHLYRKKFYSSLWELELELQSVFDLVDHARRVLGRVRRRTMDSAPKKSRALQHDGAAERKLLGETRYP